MDIHTLQTTVRDFAAVRGWPRFHTPKNLAMALMVEAAELLEIFQWLTPDESSAAASDPAKKRHIGEELADVQIYLLQMAHQTRVDLGSAVLDKLQSNARRYPAPPGAADVALPVLAQQAASDQPVTHVLVDYENVQPTDAQLRALVPQATRLWVFHGPHQKDLATRFASFGSGLSVVPISQSGKNALDFHLSFYMGYIAARHPTGHFVVLSNDKGYEPMLEHARQLHFDVVALGVPRTRKAAAVPRKAAPRKPAAEPKPVARKAAPVKSAATKKAATKTVVAKAATAQAPAVTRPAAKLARKSPAAAPAKPAVKAAAKVPAKPPVKLAPKPTPTPKPAHKPAVARKTAAPGPAPAPALTKLETDFRKLGSRQRPARLARLRGLLKSWLGDAATAEAVDAALSRLLAAGLVTVDAGGAVSYPAR